VWTVDCVECGLWTVWSVDCGLWTVDCGVGSCGDHGEYWSSVTASRIQETALLVGLPSITVTTGTTYSKV
jgi:hypothetical protein